MKTKTKKLFLSLFAFASLAITACSGNNGGSSGAGDSSGSETTSSESSSGSNTSTTSEADVDTNLYVKVDNGEEQTIAYDEDEGTYTIGPVELTTSQVIEIYIKEDGVKLSALDIIDVEAGSAAYLDVDEDEGTVSVTSDGTYTFVFTYDDGELSLAITKEADPSQEGYAVKINNEFKALVVASIDPTGEEDVTEKYKIENLSLSANDEVSFYKDGEVLAVLSDKEDSTNVNNINEHSVSEDTTTPFTIHNDATVGIYFKHRVGTDPAPYDGWRFWITGYQGEAPVITQREFYFAAPTSGAWAEYKVYAFGASGEKAAWPGEAMESVGYNDLNQEVFHASVPGEYTSVVVNNGLSGSELKQTVNIDLADDYSAPGVWYYLAQHESQDTDSEGHYYVGHVAYDPSYIIRDIMFKVNTTVNRLYTRDGDPDPEDYILEYFIEDYVLTEGDVIDIYWKDEPTETADIDVTNSTGLEHFNIGETITVKAGESGSYSLSAVNGNDGLVLTVGKEVANTFEATMNEAPLSGNNVVVYAYGESVETIVVPADAYGTTVRFNLPEAYRGKHFIVCELIPGTTELGTDWVNVARQTGNLDVPTTGTAIAGTISWGTIFLFSNNNNWTNVNCYPFKDGLGVDVKWPGNAMKLYQANNGYDQQVYVVSLDTSKYNQIVFNGSGSQTVDISIPGLTNGHGIYCDSTQTDSKWNVVDYALTYNTTPVPVV